MNMSLNAILSHLISKHISLPALKLVRECELDVQGIGRAFPKMSPSHYLQEHLLTTEQRRALLCKQQSKVALMKLGTDLVLEPAVIVFQNYKCGDVLSFPLSIRNISKAFQKFKVSMDETNIFKFEKQTQHLYKISTGMNVTIKIKFIPEDDRDYCHRLIIKTAKTRFAVPILGIGARGILDIADSINFGSVPVNHFNTKIIPVYNIGCQTAKFTLSTVGSFFVKPEKGMAAPRETFNLELSQCSTVTGMTEGHLQIKYDNGEEIYVNVTADVVDEDIRLEPAQVTFEDTYMGLKTKVLCKIRNNSSVNLDFKWCSLPEPVRNINWDEDDWDNRLTILEEKELKKESINKGSDNMEELNKEDSTAIGTSSIMIGEMETVDGFISTFQDIFAHESFLIQPLIGKVKPFSCAEIYAVFAPKSNDEVDTLAYLDVTGRQDRVPFQMAGKGLGPKFAFGFEVLDVGEVFMGGIHYYEIPVVNIGQIRGHIDCLGSASGQFQTLTMKVEPKRLMLVPQEHGAFYVSFSTEQEPATFNEELKFGSKTSEIEFYVTVKGRISSPEIKCGSSASVVSFGDVSYAFPKSVQIPLTNESLNSLDAMIKIEGDGSDLVVNFEKLSSSVDQDSFAFDPNPAEFIIEPSAFEFKAKGVQNIKVTLYANQIGDIQHDMICYMRDSEGQPIYELFRMPLKATSIVPELKPEKSEIYMRDVYVNFPVDIELKIRNDTELPAAYCIVPQQTSSIAIDGGNLIGVAEPRKVTTVPAKITCTTLKKGNVVYFDCFAFGNEKKLFTFTVTVDTIPSKLSVSSQELDFGTIPTLKTSTMTLEFSNKTKNNMHYGVVTKNNEADAKPWDISVIPEVGEVKGNNGIGILEIRLTLQRRGPHEGTFRIYTIESLDYVDIRVKAVGGPGIMRQGSKFTCI